MIENSTNLISKRTGKWTGNESETNFIIASIVGTGKSIDFYLFNEGWLLPLIGLSLCLLVQLNSYYLLYLIMHYHC